MAQAQSDAIEAHNIAKKAEETLRQKEKAAEDALNKLKAEKRSVFSCLKRYLMLRF